jgi:hypothetical protein
MANTLKTIPKIFARGLPTLRENAVLPRLVTDYSFMVGNGAQKGDTITFPVGADQTGAAITPGPTPPSNSDVAQTEKTLTIDTHWGTRFHLTDQELTQIDASPDFVPVQMERAFKVLGNKVDTDLNALYKDIYGTSGVPGTTPFASNMNAWSGSSGARKVLLDQLAPLGPWNVVVDTAAGGNLLSLAEVRSAEQRGSADTVQTARIGHVLGADWTESQTVQTHSAGTLTDGTGMLALVNDASYTVGESTVDIDASSLSGTVVKGDMFTVAGDSQQYVVTAGATASGNALAGMAFTPTSKVAWANNAQITFTGGGSGATDSVSNLAFHPTAFGIAFAKPQDVAIVEGGPTLTQTDPQTGIVIRLKVREQYYQTTWFLDILYGVKTIMPEYAARILG